MLRDKMFRSCGFVTLPAEHIFCLLCRPFPGGFFIGTQRSQMLRKAGLCLTLCLALAGCASGPPELPYPAFVQVDELPDVFMASMPGVRAKQLAGDPKTRRGSKRIDVPPEWSGTSGGMPGRSLEFFVVEGSMTVADIELGRGGYAFLPAGSLGFNLRSEEGATILYFLNDVDPESVIRSPIIIDATLLEWQATDVDGVATKELRRDPGNGAATWLLRIEPGASLPWEKSSTTREGYLLQGSYQHSECFLGEAETGQYVAGGYFYRPGGTINGGPDAMATSEATWLLREAGGGRHETVPACVDTPAQSY